MASPYWTAVLVRPLDIQASFLKPLIQKLSVVNQVVKPAFGSPLAWMRARDNGPAHLVEPFGDEDDVLFIGSTGRVTVNLPFNTDSPAGYISVREIAVLALDDSPRLSNWDHILLHPLANSSA